ncbi:MAG: discoidin domain-containing protein [Acidimicrobiia bacterium]
MRTALTIAVLAILAAACSSGADSEVLPFSEIQASEFSFEPDPFDPNRAIFRVTTTEPSICSITWGETEALGNQNNSLSMDGTGIIQHDVILPGATAGETYYFTVQGTTADGRLFQSDMATFTLPADRPAATDDPVFDPGANLALAATVVDYSSEFSDAFSADRAIDGDQATEWSTRGDGDAAFIVIDLGSDVLLGGFDFITRSMADGTAVTTEYTVTIDGGDALGPFPAGTPAQSRMTSVDITGRLLRFDIDTSTGGNTGAVEIRVFGPQG